MSVLLAFLVKIAIGFLGAWLSEQSKTSETEKAGAQAQAQATEQEADAKVTAAQAAAGTVSASDAKPGGLQLAEQSDPDNRDNAKPN